MVASHETKTSTILSRLRAMAAYRMCGIPLPVPFLALMTVASPAPAQVSAREIDRDQIVTVLRQTFDRPEARLAIAPVVVSGDHGIAGWVQDKRGGRALMRRVHGKWTIHLCSGDSLKDADTLQSTGIPPSDANALAEQLAAAERSMPVETIKLFGAFEGTAYGDAHPKPSTEHRGQGHRR